jgi:hypothetical protein
MLKGSVLVTYAALVAAEFVRGVGLIASGALTYGLLGGALPAEGGYDRIVAYASFATIALGALDLLLLGLIALRAATGNHCIRTEIVQGAGGQPRALVSGLAGSTSGGYASGARHAAQTASALRQRGSL